MSERKSFFALIFSVVYFRDQVQEAHLFCKAKFAIPLFIAYSILIICVTEKIDGEKIIKLKSITSSVISECCVNLKRAVN